MQCPNPSANVRRSWIRLQHSFPNGELSAVSERESPRDSGRLRAERTASTGSKKRGRNSNWITTDSSGDWPSQKLRLFPLRRPVSTGHSTILVSLLWKLTNLAGPPKAECKLQFEDGRRMQVYLRWKANTAPDLWL